MPYTTPLPTAFSKGSYKDNCQKVGGTDKGNRIVSARLNLEAAENEIAFKMDRSEDQRNQRRAKRK